MKKILLSILCLFCITSNYSYGLTQQEYENLLKDKQIILQNFNKDNDKFLTKDELKRALNNTESEIFYIHRMENADHFCYPNGVIKQTKIISSDGSITYHYFNIYGIEVGSLTYKNNKLIASTRPAPKSQVNQQIVSSNNENYISNSKDIFNGKLYSIGDMYVKYHGDKLYSIGDMYVKYHGDKLYSIGDMYVKYHGDKLYSIGDMYVKYHGDKLYSIGDMYVKYR